MNKKSLSESLTQFLSSEDSFENPYNESSDIERRKAFENEQKQKKKEKKDKKKDSFEEFVTEVQSIVEEDDDDEDFDAYLQEFMLEDEDDQFRNELIKRGRQYNRNTASSKEASELQKLYAGNERRIENLLKEMAEDSKKVQEDITHLRMSRSKNYKALAELVGERRGYHDTTLNAIKELNNMTKAKVELQLKVDKEHKDEAGDGDIIATRAIQNIFGMGRSNLIGSYADVSGSTEAGATTEYSEAIDEDQIIHDKYFKDDDDRPETDGDKFLKYEDLNVELILEIDDEGNPIQIVAEDQDGNVIPDYPTVEISDDLSFNVSESTGTATDNLSQKYKLRKV